MRKLKTQIKRKRKNGWRRRRQMVIMKNPQNNNGKIKNSRINKG